MAMVKRAMRMRPVQELSRSQLGWFSKGSSINYVIADRGGGVSPKDYGIT